MSRQLRVSTLTAALPARWLYFKPEIMVMCLGMVAALLAHQSSIVAAVTVWGQSSTYQFAWIVLPTMLFLVWYRRRNLLPGTARGQAWGVVLAVGAALLWLVADLLDINEGRQLSLLAGLWAIALASVGWQTFRPLFPALALLVFMVPTGTFLLTPLKYAAMKILAAFTMLTGLPFSSQGFTLFIGNHRYVIIDDCAGLPYVLIGLFLGHVLGLLIYERVWKIVAMALLGGVMAILGNGLRIISIVLYDYYTGTQIGLSGHAHFELAAMAIVFTLLFCLFARLRPDPRPERLVEIGADRPSRPAWSIGMMAALIVITGPVFFAPNRPGIASFDAQVSLPLTLARYSRIAGSGMDWTPSARNSVGQVATYESHGRLLMAFQAVARDLHVEISAESVDLKGRGKWIPGQAEVLSVCSLRNCRKVQHTKYIWQKTNRVRHVYSVFANGGQTTPSPIYFRLLRAWSRLAQAPTLPRVIAFAVEEVSPLSEKEVAALLDALVPLTRDSN